MPTDMSERGLEILIASSLREDAGYIEGNPSDYDRAYCIDKAQLLEFLRATQPQAVAKLTTTYGTRFEDKLLPPLQ